MIRYYLIPALVFVLSLGACSKDSNSPADGETKDSTNNPPPSNPPGNPPAAPGKKGADFSTNMQYGAWNDDIVALKAHWYYTWGKQLQDASPKNCEFVPMFWGQADVTTNNINAI